LRDLPVLAVQTVEVAPCHRQGKGLGSRIEMQEGLFFHRINMDHTGIPVGKGVEFAINVDLGIALSPAARHDNTPVRAGPALDPPLGHRGIEIGFFDVAVCRRKTLLGPHIMPPKYHRATGGAKGSLNKISTGRFHGYDPLGSFLCCINNMTKGSQKQ
jgi:hypothetical protein